VIEISQDQYCIIRDSVEQYVSAMGICSDAPDDETYCPDNLACLYCKLAKSVDTTLL